MEGQPPRIRNVHDAFIQIYKDGGMKGLWRGSVVNVQRAALVSLGDLATYDFVKHYLMNNFGFVDNYKTHTLSRLVSFNSFICVEALDIFFRRILVLLNKKN